MSKMKGADALNKAFKAITLNLSTPINQASRKALKPILASAKSNLTPGHGVETGHLKKILTIKADPQRKGVMQVGPDSKDPHYRVGHLVEFGTAPHEVDGSLHPGAEPRPYLGPAYEQNADLAVEIFGKEIGPAIEKAASRAVERSKK